MRHSTPASQLAAAPSSVMARVGHRPALSRGAPSIRCADGSSAMLGCPLYLAQFENCCFILLVESADVVVTSPQEPRDVGRSAVAEPNPNELRWGASQKGKSVKIFVLADEQAPVLTCQIPDDRIRRPALPQQSNV